MSLGIRDQTQPPKPTNEEVEAAREQAFAAVVRWLDLAKESGKSLPAIMRELGQMMRT